MSDHPNSLEALRRIEASRSLLAQRIRVVIGSMESEFDPIGPLFECTYCGEEYPADCWDECPYCPDEEELPL